MANKTVGKKASSSEVKRKTKAPAATSVKKSKASRSKSESASSDATVPAKPKRTSSSPKTTRSATASTQKASPQPAKTARKSTATRTSKSSAVASKKAPKQSKTVSSAAEATTSEPAPKRSLKLVQKGGPRLATKSAGSKAGSGNGDATFRYRPAAEPELREPLTEAELLKCKSGLKKRDIDRYRDILLERRAELLGDVAALHSDALSDIEKDISYDHMADAGSDSYEQEFNLGLMESEREMLHEIDDALVRIHKGIYGVCVETGEPIGKPRLDAKPWAKYCIEVARERERLGKK